jgi:hypothetical protein
LIERFSAEKAADAADHLKRNWFGPAPPTPGEEPMIASSLRGGLDRGSQFDLPEKA